MVTGVEMETAFVLMVKYGEEVRPAATVTSAGTSTTAGLELVNKTVTAAVAAAATVPEAE